MHGRNLISIWFFIGILLTIYGVVITSVGLYDYAVGTPVTTVLGNTHPGIWWGAILLAIGIVYTWKFYPRSNQK